MRFSAATTAGRLLPQRTAARVQPMLERVDDILAGRGENSEAGRISLIAFAIRIVSAAIAFLSQVLLARWMGSFEYGVFVLVWVTTVIIGNLSCLGFHTSVIRFIPEYREQRRFEELRGVLLASRLFVMVASTVVAAAGLLGLWIFSGAMESYYVVPFYLGMVCLPMIAMSDLLQGIARGNAWALWALAPAYLIRPLLILGAMGLALALGFEPSAETAIVSSILATYVTALIQIVSISTKIDAALPAGPRKILMRQWIVVSLPIFLVESFFFILTNADVLMVGFFLDPHDVAIYYATVKTLALVHFVYFAVKAGVAQRYAQLAHDGARSKLAAFASETVTWTFWPSLAMGLVVLLVGKPMIGLFGPGFDAGYPLLFVLVAGVVFRSAVGPAESLLTMTGNQNICAAVYAVTLAVNVALNIVLIPAFGLWGAALAVAIAMVFEASALSFTVWRRLGIVMFALSPAALSRRSR